MTHEELSHYVAFSHAPGIGPTRFTRLMESFGDIKSAFEAQERDISNIVGSKIAHDFCHWRKTFDPGKVINRCRGEIYILPRSHTSFPIQLRQISDPPICLYVRCGEKPKTFLREDILYFSVVGSRKYSSYGHEMTTTICSTLAGVGITIVSGMASGIDAIAHTAALDASGRTIAFLGCGVDVIYPKENKKLYERIISEGGLIISEFAPGVQPIPGFFIARNRLVAGLSKGILIVEGTSKSGSLVTASIGAHQGKEIYAIPGQATSPLAQAPLILLKQGAKLVTSAEDILSDLSPGYNTYIDPKRIAPSLDDPLEKAIYGILLVEQEIYPDQLAIELQIPITQIMTSLSLLELKMVTMKNQSGSFSLK